MGWASSLEVAASNHGLAATGAAAYAVVVILLVVAAVVDQTPSSATTAGTAVGWALPVARAGGAVVHLNAALLLLSGCRVVLSVATPVAVALPVDRVLPGGHMAAAAAAAVAAAVHVAGHVVHLATGGGAPPGRTGTMVLVSGGVLVAVLVSLRLVTLKWVRVHRREVFAVGHGVLAIAAVVLLGIHGLHRGVPSSVKWLVPAGVVYALDLMVRRRRTHTAVLTVDVDADAASCAADSETAPPTSSRRYGNVLCLAMPRPFSYVAGQSVLLRVPAVSRHQWHPFTIASAPADPILRLYVKDAGDWTGALLNLWRSNAAAAIAEDRQTGGARTITVHVQGPYGAPTQHAASYDRLVLIGAGIGATPFVSVVQHFAATTKGKNDAATAAASADTQRLLSRTPISPASGSFASADPVHAGAQVADGRVRVGETTAAVSPSAVVATTASGVPFPGAVAIEVGSTSTVTAESASDLDSRRGEVKATAASMEVSPAAARSPEWLPGPPVGAMGRGEHPCPSSTSSSRQCPPPHGVANGALARTTTAAWAAASARGSCADLGVSLDGFPTSASLPSSGSDASPDATVGTLTPPAVMRAHIIATSAAVGVATLWAAGGRLALLAAAAIAGAVDISNSSLALYTSIPWVVADVVLAAAVAVAVLGGLCIEAAAGATWAPTGTPTGTGAGFAAARAGRWVERLVAPLLLLHPLVAASVTFALGGPATSRVPTSAAIVHVAVLHPAAAVIAAAHEARVTGRALLGGRRRRRHLRASLSAGLNSRGGGSSSGWGSRPNLATRPRVEEATVGAAPSLSSLDFVWVVRRPDDDAWLRAELATVAATPGRVRLHRWVTQPSSRPSPLQSSPVPPPRPLPAGAATAAPPRHPPRSLSPSDPVPLSPRNGRPVLPPRRHGAPLPPPSPISADRPPPPPPAPSPPIPPPNPAALLLPTSTSPSPPPTTLFRTAPGRPDWTAVLADVASASRSGAAVGVFCCGPPAMATAVRTATAAAAAASAAAAVRYGVGGGLASGLTSGEGGAPLPGAAVGGGDRLRSDGRVAPAYGCGVRLTFRQECFA